MRHRVMAGDYRYAQAAMQETREHGGGEARFATASWHQLSPDLWRISAGVVYSNRILGIYRTSEGLGEQIEETGMPGRTGGVAVALALGILFTSLPSDAQWNKVPSVTVSAPAQDPRIQLAFDAVNLWNRQLAEIGTPFRFGAVTHTPEQIPTSYLERLSAAVLKREPRPDL